MSEGSPHLVVWIARDRLEAQLRSMLALPVREQIRFDLRMDMTDPAVRSWRRVVDLLRADFDDDCQTVPGPSDMRMLEGLLLHRLLKAQPNNYSELLHGPPRDTTPRTIRRAVELIRKHAAEPLTTADIAEAVGVSARSLQDGFRRFLENTPMAYLTEVRLERAREDLTAADPGAATVTAIATRWGFRHDSRFAARYHQCFGELPSVTLRR